MKTLFIFFLFLLNIFSLNAQSKSENNISNFPKLYLHTDREFYFQGDTLWFAAYYLDGKSQTFEFESCNLYTEIINQKGEIILTEKFILQNGYCPGYVPLSDTIIKEENYLLRAYTDYLKNFGNEIFFTKIIRVSEVKSSFDLMAEKVPPVSKVLSSGDTTVLNCPPEIRGTMEAGDSEGEPAAIGGKKDSIHQVHLKSPGEESEIDISFLPESGFLLADEPNCVAFKAVDKNGFGKNISGKLLDENGELVLTFKSVYKGAGKFYFYPKAEKTYTAKIDGYPGLEFQLPEIRETGGKIMLVNQEKKKLQVVVQSKDDNRLLPYQLIGYHKNEVLFSIETDRKKTNQIIKINGNLLKDGINRLVLFDKKYNPLSERLIFKQPEEISQIEIEVSEESFSTREEVELTLIPDRKSRYELAQVSVAVVDENYVNASGISQNIASFLLLDSELKGHIDAPVDYFVSDSLDSQTKLDLLMCINGWGNYIWNSSAPDSIRYQPQLGYTFSGNVKRFMGKKALSEGNVSMILFKNDSTSEFFDQVLDLNGNFEFRNIVFYDSASVFAQARNKKDSHNLQFELNLPEFFSPQISSSDTLQLKYNSKIPVSVYRQRYLNEMRLKEFYPEKDNILLGEVDVTAKKPRPKFKTGIPKKNDGPFKLTWEMTAGSFDIVEYLAYKVPGIISWRNSENELMVKLQAGRDIGPPAFFIDDFSYFSISEIKGWNILNFKTIEIITPPMSYAYGARAISGAVVLTLKRGDEIDPTMPLFGGTVEKVKGFTPLCEFYSPKYTPSTINAEAPDYRNTLYWNPIVNISDGGNELSFFTCDNVSRYKIFVEGITESGKICLGTGKFVVDRFKSSSGDLKSPGESALNDTIHQLNFSQQVKVPPVSEVLSSSDTTVLNCPPNFRGTMEAGDSEGEPAGIGGKKDNKNLIIGTVTNKNKQPVEFATLYNSTQKTTCISNAQGKFKLVAEIGDSVKIQHLNFQSNNYKIQKKEEDFILVEKDFLIEEVMVSPQVAFDLFNKSCENTWKTFKEENTSRAYAKCTRKLYGEVVAQEAFLDVDMIQKKLSSYKRGEKTNIYRIQEKMEKHSDFPENDLLIDLNLFYPTIQQIYWVDLPKSFNYLKREENNFIKLILSSKSTYDHQCNIEVAIHKKDTTLNYFAMVKKDIKLPFLHSKLVRERAQEVWDTIPVQKTYHFIKYDYTNGFGYLSEYMQGAVVKPDREIEISEHLRTYNMGTEPLKRRNSGKRIFANRIVLRSIKNQYETDFWKNELFPEKMPYDFNVLGNMKIKE